MQAIRNLIKIAPVARTSLQSIRPMSVVSTPARVKISKAEKIILASCMCVGWMAIPAWVVLNIKNYRKN